VISELDRLICVSRHLKKCSRTEEITIRRKSAKRSNISIYLFQVPDDTAVYPAHDHEGRISSTIGEERRFNPRLQVDSRQQYID